LLLAISTDRLLTILFCVAAVIVVVRGMVKEYRRIFNAEPTIDPIKEIFSDLDKKLQEARFQEAEVTRVLPLMEHEIAVLADMYFSAKDTDSTTADELNEREELLEGRVMQWREITEMQKRVK
jgi:hypothetical protein